MHFLDDGTIADIDEFSYDSAGKLTKCAEYDSEGELTEKNEYEYDENGNLTKHTYARVVDGKSKPATKSYSDFVYFYYPDGIPEVVGSDPYGYEELTHYNLGMDSPIASLDLYFIEGLIKNNG